MKKIKVTLALLITGVLSLTSCSSDDSGSAASIEGKWNPTKTVLRSGGNNITQNYEHEAGCAKDFIEFVDGGVFRNVVWFKDANEVCTESAAEPEVWVKNENTLTITGGEFDGTYEIKKLSGSDLQIESEQTGGGVSSTITVYFKKAPATN